VESQTEGVAMGFFIKEEQTCDQSTELQKNIEEVIARVSKETQGHLIVDGDHDMLNIELTIMAIERRVDHHIGTFANCEQMQKAAPQIKAKFAESIRGMFKGPQYGV
jgi:hypothetical protein